MKSLYETLKSARREKKWTQLRLAEALGVDQGNISRVESGKKDLLLTNFIEMARVLDLEVMLIPKQQKGTVKALTQGSDHHSDVPEWRRLEEDSAW